MENENAARKNAIESILNQELQDGADLGAEARRTIEYLLLDKKGYEREEVKKDFTFEVTLGSEKFSSSVDFLITIGGTRAMIIKCAAGSLSSRERQAVAAARSLGDTPVPIAVVADPVTAEVLDVATGKIIGEGFGAIPLRVQLAELLAAKSMKPLAPERIEKEKRILLAFDAIRCCVPRGADGGVQIGPDPGQKKPC